jgi:alanyl-tRNA synthetase
MSALTSTQIRRAFLDFFAGKSHEIVASSSLVPANDPTLMFVNAGMVQFKDVFTGKEKRSYRRAASSQKVMRVSGKHNDLENVGRTARHHTFFEMLGNFSFGDYFKEDAIAFAWEFFTKVLGLPQDRLVVTVFRGDGAVPADDEARAVWRKVTGFGDDRIIGLGLEDNFWQMGETGPCGPCSEIYFFHGDRPDVARLGDEPSPDGTGWVELWNLVFMQFERSIDGGEPKLTPLPAPCIDTGAGLERLSGALSGHRSNYETDLFRPLIDKAAALAKKSYRASAIEDDVSMRVIADHARAAAFLIADGVMPDRTGREYVLRRVMRRAIRHGHRLGIERPFLHEVALAVVELMGGHYTELRERRDLIASVTEQEEVRFRQTIDRGLGILDEELTRMRSEGRATLSGEAAFKLYDTYGFPIDLTEVICDEKGVGVDLAGYQRALDETRARSEFVGDSAVALELYRQALDQVPGKQVRFVGYERETSEGRVVAILQRGALVDRAKAEAGAQFDAPDVEIVLDSTPFYGEAGGQIGDRGELRAPGVKLEVDDTQKPVTGLIVHRAFLRDGEIAVGQTLTAEVDHQRRDATRRAHSATHLLHFALRRVLGEQAQQKGSLVEPDRFRFDFTSGRALTAEERARVEDLVNEKILVNAPVETEVLPIDQAKKRGAVAIFEEKYGDVVRVLTMTPDSIELCGGTHARATGDIGLFKIVSEGGIAAGVRRIEARTGVEALKYVRHLESTLGQAALAVKASGSDVVDKIEKLVLRERALDKKVIELSSKLAMGGGGGGEGALLAQARDIGGVKVLGVAVDVSDAAALRELAEKLRDKLGDSVVMVGSKSGPKVQLVLTVARSLVARLKAPDLIRPLAQIVGGSGGGRPDMAQAGGTDVSKLDEALQSLPRVVGAAIGVGEQVQA